MEQGGEQLQNGGEDDKKPQVRGVGGEGGKEREKGGRDINSLLAWPQARGTTFGIAVV